jgi:hypothetical protein
MENSKSTKVITGKVRFSYPSVFVARAAEEGGAPKFSVSILIPKTSKKMIAEIEAAIEAAAASGGAKFENKDPKKIKKFHWPLRDGDEEKEDDEAYKGMYFLSAKSNTKPGVVDVDREAIVDPQDFYAGCYGRASINFYAFSMSGNKGIACGLNNLQKLEDGERLAGGSSVDDDFGDDLEGEDLLG